MSRAASTSTSVHATGSSSRPLSASASATDELCSDLARELRHRWRAGECPPADEFFARDRQLIEQPEAAVELIYEEFCARDAAGDGDAEADLVRRFPQWAGPLRVMVDCHRRVIHSQRERPRFPAAGERVGEFKLTSEVARGARGRVFVATQAALANRPVVLKITPLDGREHLSLARLQHTHIVPLYSVFDDVIRKVRVLCMPFFGRATLASVLEALSRIPIEQRTGCDIVAAVDGLQGKAEPADARPADAPATTAHASAARQTLQNVSYVEAACWIGACLADALSFAHERGVLHLDLKPSNVLLANDGQPMLLDFHLAREPIRPGGPLPENVGGTPPYMPPEQHAAMRALQEGKPVEQPVDVRADVFALGAILYESLSGRPPAPDAPPLVGLNPHVTPGLSDVVAKCLASRAEDRYIHPRSLADDLRRHLTDEPLAGVANRSVGERWRKWRRRRPHAGAVAAAAIATLMLLALAWQFAHDRHQQAQAALADGQRLMRDPRDVAQAVQSFERGLALLSRVPFEQELRSRLHEQLDAARREHIAQQLHRLADEVRVVYGSARSPQESASLGARCVVLWGQRTVILGSLEPSHELSADLQDLAIFAAHVSTKGDAERLLNEAEAAFGATAVLEQERRRHGLSPSSKTRRAPGTAWEHYALGRALLAADDLDRAREHLAIARRLAPADRWSNFYYGLCAYRTNRPAEAVAAFSTCIGASPDVAGCYYNRALAYTELGQPDQAIQDYNRTIQLDPANGPALLNRGVLHSQQRHWDDAVADLNLALKHGQDPATVHYDLALVYHAWNDRPQALAHLDRALKSTPTHPRANQLRDTLREELTGAKSSIR